MVSRKLSGARGDRGPRRPPKLGRQVSIVWYPRGAQLPLSSSRGEQRLRRRRMLVAAGMFMRRGYLSLPCFGTRLPQTVTRLGHQTSTLNGEYLHVESGRSTGDRQASDCRIQSQGP